MPPLEIHIPGSFVPERNYILTVIFGDFLGLDFKIKIHEETGSYLIKVPEGRDIIIKDHFFSGFSESSGYLHKSNIPDKVKYFNDFFPGFEDTPVLYGDAAIIYYDKYIQLEADIIASSFYMLTRWEEHVIENRDNHDRFSYTESLAYKFDFLNRPVVNEYAEILWNLLIWAGYTGKRAERKFRIIPTHDIDHLFYWNSERRKNLLKNLLGDLFKRKQISIALMRIISFIKTLININNDPNLSFDYLMSLAESANLKAVFFFISAKQNKFDPDLYLATPIIGEIIEKINNRAHNIGIHPSYESYNNLSVLKKEFAILNEIISKPLEESRQHYLRFEVPGTWRILNECKLKTDTTMYYSGFPGFRCGTCYEFRVFDILERKILDLTERPLLIMDTCLLKRSAEEARQIVKKIKGQVKRHHGDFVFNWHNSNVSWSIENEFRTLFEKEFYDQ